MHDAEDKQALSSLLLVDVVLSTSAPGIGNYWPALIQGTVSHLHVCVVAVDAANCPSILIYKVPACATAGVVVCLLAAHKPVGLQTCASDV